jgi:hypothetical protein
MSTFIGQRWTGLTRLTPAETLGLDSLDRFGPQTNRSVHAHTHAHSSLRLNFRKLSKLSKALQHSGSPRETLSNTCPIKGVAR